MKSCVLFVVLMGIAAGAWAGSTGNAVEVQIRSDSGRTLPLYPVAASYPNQKLYAEAVKGDLYSIIIHNLLNRRVGVVVAVDGRNIISGRKSGLGNDERMYILEPYARGEFKGWRTTLASINRFYFTDVADSYAAAFRDETAMGVIAVAVYPEMQRREEPRDLSQISPRSDQRGAPSAKAEGESAGTGFGSQEYSPAKVVAFEPEGTAAERVYIKYEWRATLCWRRIIPCGGMTPRNRMWGDDDFAPPPPDRS
jgi:hypothetical protein